MPDPDFGARLAPLRARFTAACDRWRLGDADRAALLGVPLAALDRWRAGDALDDAEMLPPSPADRAALAVELDAVLRFVPGAELDVAVFLRRPGTAPAGVGTARDALLARPAGLAAVRAHLVTLALPRLLSTLPEGPGGRGDLAETYPDLHHDPIVAEVRAIREVLFAEAGYDLQELGRQSRACTAVHGAPRAFGGFAHRLPEGADPRRLDAPRPEDERRASDGGADAHGTGDGGAR